MDCGGKRSATPLWVEVTQEVEPGAFYWQVKRRRASLAAAVQSDFVTGPASRGRRCRPERASNEKSSVRGWVNSAGHRRTSAPLPDRSEPPVPEPVAFGWFEVYAWGAPMRCAPSGSQIIQIGSVTAPGTRGRPSEQQNAGGPAKAPKHPQTFVIGACYSVEICSKLPP
jgi:hypothetical protein